MARVERRQRKITEKLSNDKKRLWIVLGLVLRLRQPSQRVAKALCVTRDKGSNLYVTRESYLKRNVIREYLNACDA